MRCNVASATAERTRARVPACPLLCAAGRAVPRSGSWSIARGVRGCVATVRSVRPPGVRMCPPLNLDPPVISCPVSRIPRRVCGNAPVGHVAEASDRRPVEAAPSHRAARTSLAPAPGARASRFLFLSLSKPRCPHTRPARCSVRRHARGSVRSPSTFPPFRRAVHYCTAREAHHAKECSPVSLKPTAERPPCVRGGLRRWTRHVVKAGWVKLTGRGTMGAGVRSSRRCWTPPAP